MATITKRGDTYRIRTSCGYDVNGKQVIKSMIYKPQEGMSEKQLYPEDIVIPNILGKPSVRAH